jgi:hypothetical protein
MAYQLVTLRLEAADGSGIEEYRICEDGIEARNLPLSPEQPGEDAWRRLSARDLAAHVQNKTIVAQWLQRRLGWRRLLRACIDPEILRDFGVAENTPERYAA